MIALTQKKFQKKGGGEEEGEENLALVWKQKFMGAHECSKNL